ncbi:MAG: SGNH/GDSL hydrolase family protein [Pseudomonadota bacterium]
MKTVLAFGDSLTWGLIPGTRARYPRDVRWPKVLEARLGGKVEVIENGLNARTSVHENPFRDYRRGLDILPSLLEAHAPLDLLILMLGSNDFHSNLGLDPENVARGMRRLVQFTKTYVTEPDMPLPEILIVAPPKIVPTNDSYYGPLFGETHALHHRLAPLYQVAAQEEGAHFFDAATVASGDPLDGIHLSADATIKIGEALVTPVSKILSL